MKNICLLLFACLLFSRLFSQDAPSAHTAIDALRQGNHEEAIKGFSGDLATLAAATDGVAEDELRLHQARAYQLAGKNGEAVKLCDALLKAFPESKWRHKVVFLKAQALAADRKFREALVIYQAEAGRIFSEKRQDEVAGQLMMFAELFATEPAPEELDAPAADYGKALILFAQVLDTDCSVKVREKVRSRMVELNVLLKKWGEAEKVSLAYLDEFDPAWRGTFGSVRRLTNEKNAKVTFEGPKRFKVRFHHAEALHRLNRRPEAVRYLRELEEMTKEAADQVALRADAMWLRLMAMTENGAVRDVDEWVKEARAYLALYPKHIWAAQVAHKIASVYRSAELWEKARGAYQEYLDGKGYQAPAEKPLTLDVKSAGEFEIRKRRHEERREAASFEIGAIFLAEKKFNEAEAQWNKTAKNFPNGEKWAECQKGLVQVDFERALESVRKVHKGKMGEQVALRDEARKSLEGFLTGHPLDVRLPQLMFALGELSYYEAVAAEDGAEFKLTAERQAAFEKAIADWRRLVSKYPKSAQAKAAEVKIGGIYEHYLGDLEKAVEIYSGLKDGQSRKAVLMSKVLKASSPRVFGTQEKPEISLTLRNVEKVKIRQYWIDFESFFRKSQNLSEIEKLDVDLVEPDKSWEVVVPKYQRYLPMEHQVAIPFEDGKAGVCVIKVEGGDLESTTVTVRSDIDLAVRSSREEALILVRDWKTGKVAPGVKLVLADGAKVIANGMTGADGVWHYEDEALKEVSQLRVLGISERGMAGHSLQVAGLSLPAPLVAKGTLMTSRGIYRPGESVNLKVVVRDVKDGGFVVSAEEERDFVLKVRDAAGRLLKESKVVLNDFGTSQVQFGLPEQLRGNHVKLSLEGTMGGKKMSFPGMVMISHEGLRWVEVDLNFEKKNVAPGEVIKGRVTAKYRWGAPLANRAITLHVPGGLKRVLQTDEKGGVSFEFPTKGVANVPLTFGAAAPSTDAHLASGQVRIVARDFVVKASMKRSLVLAGSDFEIDLEARSLDDEARVRKLRVVLERPVEEHPDPVLVEVPGLNISRECLLVNEKVNELTVETDARTGKVKAGFKLSEGGLYYYRVFDRDLEVRSGSLTVSDEKDATKLRIFSKDEKLSEGMTARFEIHSRMGGAVPTLVSIETDKLLEYRVVEVNPGSNEFTVPLKAVHAPGFQIGVMALDDRRLHQAGLSVLVKRDLKVEMSVVGIDGGEGLPGEKVKVVLSIKDAAGNPVEAETAIAIVREDDVPVSVEQMGSFFQRGYARGLFRSGSSCGFQHQGGQQNVNLAIQEELQRQTVNGRFAVNDQALLPQMVQQERSGGGGGLGNLEDPFRTNPSLGYAQQRQVFDRATGSGGGFSSPTAPRVGRVAGSFDLRSKTVRTNEKGEAVIEMKLPGEADDWVILGEALTRSGALGGAKASVKVREDLVVRLVLPDGVVEGDSFVPQVIVSRAKFNEEAKGSVKLTMGVKGKDAVVTEREITLKKGQQTVEISFDEMATTKDVVEFEAELIFGRSTKKTQGRLESFRWGAPVVVRGGVLAKPGKSSFKVSLPDGAGFEPMELMVQASVNDFLRSLISAGHEPFAGGKLPLTGGHPAPALLMELGVLRYGMKRGLGERDLNSVRAAAEGHVASLTVRQGDDGGWSGHVGRKKSELNLSAVAFEALTLAEEVGITVDEGVLQRVEGYLRGAIAKAGSDDRALIQYALSVGGKGDFSACNRLFRSRTELSSFGKAHLAMAFIQLKRPEFAKQLLEDLGEVKTGDMLTLGRALQAWAAINANEPKAVALEQKVWGHCGAFGFVSDLARGLGSLGLASLYEAREAVAEDYRFVISVNGKEVAKGESKKPEGFGFVKVPQGFLKKGVNEVSITVEGRGLLRVGTTMTGTLKEFPKEDWNGDLKVVSREFLHPGLTYKGMPLSAKGRSPVSKVAVGDRVRVRVEARHTRREGGEVVIWEKIPAGFEYLAGSLSGAHSGARIENGYLVITHVGTMPRDKSFYYEMVAKTPGEWRVSPTMLFPIELPERATYGQAGKMEILPRGKKSGEQHQYQVSERYELAVLNFRDGDYLEAAKQLAVVRKDHANFQAAEVARMTLWIETAKEKPDARLVADSFEVLNELSPELEIPFEKILKVGNAYRELKEFERGVDVFLATLEAGFATESFVGAALEDQGRFLDALDYQAELWMDFPDYGEVANSFFALAQQIYAKAGDAKSLTPRKGTKKAPESHDLYLKSVKMLEQFRVTHPAHPLADDGVFTIANALFTLKSYDQMVLHAKASQKAYPKSDYAEAFQYLEALGNFWLRNYDAAFAAAKVVAEGSGKDKNLAAYICAQILHAQGKTVDALKWYEKVKTEYPDAKDSIAWFEQKKISLDEVKVIRSGEKVELILKHRNISKADLQIYRVDLMKLYLREKNLSNISQVNLAGIAPKHEMSVDLKNAQFSDQETKIELPMKNDGAYLVICRGDYLYTSGLVLVTPLKMEVQEIGRGSTVRVNLSDRTSEKLLDGVHVKAIGSGDEKFVSGETDMRGVWTTVGVKGSVTVIARDKEGRYAFFRGTKVRRFVPVPAGHVVPKGEQKLNYNYNNSFKQDAIWLDNTKNFDKLRRSKGKGVKVNKAIKK